MASEQQENKTTVLLEAGAGGCFGDSGRWTRSNEVNMFGGSSGTGGRDAQMIDCCSLRTTDQRIPDFPRVGSNYIETKGTPPSRGG